MKEYLSQKVNNALFEDGVSSIELIFERPKEEKYGDLSTNAAMLLAKQLKKNPPRKPPSRLFQTLNFPTRLLKM